MILCLPKFDDSSNAHQWMDIVEKTIEYSYSGACGSWSEIKEAIVDSFSSSAHLQWIQDEISKHNMTLKLFLKNFDHHIQYLRMENARETLMTIQVRESDSEDEVKAFVEKLHQAFCDLYDISLWQNCPLIVEFIIPKLYLKLRNSLKESIIEHRLMKPMETLDLIQSKHRELKSTTHIFAGGDILLSPSPSPKTAVLCPTPKGPFFNRLISHTPNGNINHLDAFERTIRSPLFGQYEPMNTTLGSCYTPNRSDHFDTCSANGSSFRDTEFNSTTSLSDENYEDTCDVENCSIDLKSTPTLSSIVGRTVNTPATENKLVSAKEAEFKPSIIGYYSIENDQMSLDKKTLPVVIDQIKKLKPNLKFKVCYNLTDGYDEKLDVKMAPGISDLLTYLSKAKHAINYKVLPDPRPVPFDFVTMCGVLVNIMTLPYKKDFNQVIYVQKFQGTIYLATFAYDRMLDKETFSGLRFEKYASRTNSTSTNYHNHFNCLTKMRIGKYNVLYNTKMDAAKDKDANLYDPNSFVEFKTKHQRYYESEEKLLGSMMQWWARCHISGVNDIVCGYKNDALCVTNIVKYTKKEIEEKTKKSKKCKPFSNQGFNSGWDMNSCMDYLRRFLEHINCVMYDLEELKVYGFIGKCNENDMKKAWNHREMSDKEILTQDFILNYFPVDHKFTHIIGRKRNPCIIIKNFHSKLNGEELIYRMTSQNKLNIKDSKGNLNVKFINYPAAFAVLEVDPEVYPNVCNMELKIVNETCNTEKFTYITQCTKCFKYFHTNEACVDEKTCSHCAEKHMYSECSLKDDKSAIKCSNCHAWNQSVGEVSHRYPTDHVAINRRCPIRDRLRNIIDAITDYRNEAPSLKYF